MFHRVKCWNLTGNLVDYSFSKGHLTYTAEAAGFHNTLLLHDATDSMTFFFEGAAHTDSIHLELEHPQMELKDVGKIPLFPQGDQPAAAAGEFQVNLPAGPLYSRITVEVAGKMKVQASKYPGRDSVRYSQTSDSNGTNISAFTEQRRWLYQEKMPEWYVPNLTGTATLEVELRPVCFAPLGPAENGGARVVRYAGDCLCGKDRTGAGNECPKETVVKLGIADTSKPLCLFWQESERRTSVDELKIDRSSKASLGKGSDMVEWLQDVQRSGKSAKLRMDPQDNASESDLQLEWKLSAENATEFQVSNIFSVSMSSEVLIQSAQLVVSTTLDQTDAEEQAVPLRIVPHSPPIVLSIGSGSNAGFLLPAFNVNNRRNDYAVCGLPDVRLVQGEDVDSRFGVDMRVLELEEDCFRDKVSQKQFWAFRNDSNTNSAWYPPWNDNYDVAVTLSPQRCLNEAIDLGDITAVQRIMDWIPEGQPKHYQNSCRLLQRAIRLDRPHMIPELLKFLDPGCENCTETPLGVAAAEGKLEAMDLLLAIPEVKVDAMDSSGATPLFRAAQHCRIDAVKRLLRAGSDVNHRMPPKAFSGCLAGMGCCGDDGATGTG
eukprot:Skav235868  [mRNA]  locus=scaffold1693:348437:350816:- [translate_table: standard]